MDARKQQLKGSPSRDVFKLMHKQTHPQHYGCDCDFAAIEKYPFPHVAFYMDHKWHEEPITFTEIVAYNAWILTGPPLFIIRGDPQSGSFDIYRYVGGHHGKPTWTEVFVCSTANWAEYHDWEACVRKESRDRFDPREHTHGG